MKMLTIQLLIGCLMIGITVIIHAVALSGLLHSLKRIGPIFYHNFQKFWEIPIIIITVLGVFLTHVAQIWIWALLFLYLEPKILPDFESALYFATSSFTTVGFGDIYLDKEWRLLSSFTAANGFILFGCSTAFIFEIISKLYKDDRIRKTK